MFKSKLVPNSNPPSWCNVSLILGIGYGGRLDSLPTFVNSQAKAVPIPNIRNTLHELEGFEFGTSLDLNIGYYHIGNLKYSYFPNGKTIVLFPFLLDFFVEFTKVGKKSNRLIFLRDDRGWRLPFRVVDSP